MYVPSLGSCFVAVFLASSTAAVPWGVEKRQAAASCDLGREVFQPACWHELKVPEYLTQWRQNTPDCALSGGNGTDCCNFATEKWSKCFLRLAVVGGDRFDCSMLDESSCTAYIFGTLRTDLSPSIMTQVSYVLGAMVRMNSFFTSLNNCTFVDSGSYLRS